MFQYTVTNPRFYGPFSTEPAPVVCRTKDRGQVLGWVYMRVVPSCLDRARYGLAEMERRAACAVQYSMFGKDRYLCTT